MDESLIREQEAQLQKTGRYYKHICFMAVPVLCMACFLYGVRPLLLCGIAVLTGNLCDRLVSLLRRRVYQGSDFSNESFALVIALLMPVTVDIYVLIAAVLAGVLIGKEIFGGYGSYPFNPAAVGYVVAAVSWPEQVFRYPQPYTNIPLWDASMVPVSSAIEDTLRSGGMLNIGSLALGLGEYAAPMGTGAALVILACGLFLWTQKDAHMSASISFLVTCAVIAFFFPRQAGLADSAVLSNILPRLQCVRDELLTGAILFSAVFLINEPYTCVHHRMGRVLYGVLVGVVSMGFRYYGVYETGVCFALLAVNSVSAWIDRTEAKLYHLTHLQADAGKGASTMRRATAELIVKDPNKFAHHDRVFLNNPVVMQGHGPCPAGGACHQRPECGDAGGGGGAAAGALPRAGLSAEPPCAPARRGPRPGNAAKKAAAPCTGVRLQHGGGVSGGVSYPEYAVQHQPAEPWHLPAPAHGGAAADLPLWPRAGDGAQGCLQGSAHHGGLCFAAGAAGLRP